MVQGDDLFPVESVSASSMGSLLPLSGAARSILEADKQASEGLDASAAPADNRHVSLISHGAEPDPSSSSPSAGVLGPFTMSLKLL